MSKFLGIEKKYNRYRRKGYFYGTEEYTAKWSFIPFIFITIIVAKWGYTKLFYSENIIFFILFLFTACWIAEIITQFALFFLYIIGEVLHKV
jgi:hypothetical protein